MAKLDALVSERGVAEDNIDKALRVKIARAVYRGTSTSYQGNYLSYLSARDRSLAFEWRSHGSSIKEKSLAETPKKELDTMYSGPTGYSGRDNAQKCDRVCVVEVSRTRRSSWSTVESFGRELYYTIKQ
eukprot:1527905-Amphidinium_carterae.1